MTPNIADIIRHHVSLEVRCIDRLYVQGDMPKLQTSGGLCYFLHDHLGYPVPSPALLKPRHDRFVAAVAQFADRHRIPVIAFESGESKDARVARYRARFTASDGVVILGVAQEKMRSFKAHKRPGRGHTPVFEFSATIGRSQPLLFLRSRSGLGTGLPQNRHLPAAPRQALPERA